jgi:hypothetical protein
LSALLQLSSTNNNFHAKVEANGKKSIIFSDGGGILKLEIFSLKQRTKVISCKNIRRSNKNSYKFGKLKAPSSYLFEKMLFLSRKNRTLAGISFHRFAADHWVKSLLTSIKSFKRLDFWQFGNSKSSGFFLATVIPERSMHMEKVPRTHEEHDFGGLAVPRTFQQLTLTAIEPSQKFLLCWFPGLI